VKRFKETRKRCGSSWLSAIEMTAMATAVATSHGEETATEPPLRVQPLPWPHSFGLLRAWVSQLTVDGGTLTVLATLILPESLM